MSRSPWRTTGVAMLLALTFAIAGCRSAPRPPATGTAGTGAGEPRATAAGTYMDPIAYCAAVGDLDRPSSDPRYAGPAVPRGVIETYAAAAGTATPSADLLQHPPALPWRCMGGRVYVCVVGVASGNGCAAAKTISTPTPRMEAWCAQPRPTPPSGLPDFVPMSETDNPSVYEWECRDGHAVAVGPPAAVDTRGFVRDHWAVVALGPGSASPTATAATPFPTVTPLTRGEIVTVDTAPYPAAHMDDATAEVDVGALDLQQSSLVLDRATARLYQVPGAWLVCFVPTNDGRPVAIASTPPGTGNAIQQRTLLLRFDPFEAQVLDVPMRVVAACPGESPGHPGDPHAVDVEVFAPTSLTKDGRRLPPGRYSFDPGSLQLTFVRTEPPYGAGVGAGAPDGSVVARWPGADAGAASIELVRRFGENYLEDATSGRTILVGVDEYAVSPGGRLLATSASAPPGGDRRAYVVDLASGAVTPIGIDATGGFAWSPDGSWVSAFWRGSAQAGGPATSVIEVRSGSGPSVVVGPVLGPFDGRVVEGWTADGTLLMARPAPTTGSGVLLETLDVTTGRVAPFASETEIDTAAVSPDGTAIATSGPGALLAVRSLPNGGTAEPRALDGATIRGAFNLSWSSDSRWLAACVGSTE